jgi:hypothetical protein
MSYNQTDQKLHQLSQILGKFNRTYIPKKEDDSHTNMGYGPVNRRLFGRRAELGDSRYMLSLELNPLSFVLLDDSYRRELEVVCLGKTVEQIESELSHSLALIGFDPKGFSSPMHFEIPDYELSNQPVENLSEADYRKWTDLRAIANSACYQIQSFFQVIEEVRIWPHHFDTGIFVPLNDRLSIGFGMAMKDSMSDDPYFYYTAKYEGQTRWPEDHPMSLDVGEIIDSEEWCGAILKAPEVQLEELRSFMREASLYYLGFL